MAATLRQPILEPSPNTTAQESSEDLLRRYYATGCADLFSELVLRHQHSAYRVAFARCGQSELAEEAVQEAFMLVARGDARPKFLPPGGFHVWFLGVASNVARDALKAERRKSRRLRQVPVQEQLRTVSEDRMTPSTEGLDAESRAELLRAMAGLKEEHRTPLILHFMEGLTQEQVGELTGLSQSRVARRIGEGLGILRLRLAQRGMASTALIPAALSDAAILQAPASLQAALSKPGLFAGLARVPVPLPSARMRPKAGLTVRAAVVGALVASAAGLALWLAHARTAPRQKPAAPAGPAAAQAEAPAATLRPQVPQALRRTWNFDAEGTAADLIAHIGPWRWAKSQGMNASGCMEAAQAPFLFEIQQEIPRTPALVIFYIRPAGVFPGDQIDTVAVRWTKREDIALISNLSPKLSVNVDLRPPQWIKVEALLTDRFQALYCDGNLAFVHRWERGPDSRILVLLHARFFLDGLEIQAPAERATDDVAPLLEALERMPPAERKGERPLPGVPERTPGHPVMIQFIEKPLP